MDDEWEDPVMFAVVVSAGFFFLWVFIKLTGGE